MIIKRYKNGNFTAKMEESDYNRESTLINLIWGLFDADCTLFGEEYCISNWEMAVDMYCYYTDANQKYAYMLVTAESDNFFYTINIACDYEDLEESRLKMLEYAISIEVE
jgi:hypothetical protein